MIVLPFPPKILWPNGPEGNRYQKARERKMHKELAFWAIKEKVPCFSWNGEPIQLRYTITPKTRHKIDKDNCIAAMKAYQDGISLALKVDDSAFAEPVIEFAEPEKPGRITVDFSPALPGQRFPETGGNAMENERGGECVNTQPPLTENRLAQGGD